VKLCLPSAIATLALAGALAAPAVADPITVTVYIFNYDYSQIFPVPPYPPDPPPDDPVIHVGDTIRWQRYNGTHNVKSCAGTPEQFMSQTITSSSPTYSHTYTHAGVFSYYCTFHGFDIGDNSAGGMAGMVTVLPPPPPPCPADFGTAGGQPGHDGILDNNDFVAFIDLFFAANTAADIGKTGGIPGADTQFDNNDLVVFIDRFFAGCP
jgi:hypothetical protein